MQLCERCLPTWPKARLSQKLDKLALSLHGLLRKSDCYGDQQVRTELVNSYRAEIFCCLCILVHARHIYVSQYRHLGAGLLIGLGAGTAATLLILHSALHTTSGVVLPVAFSTVACEPCVVLGSQALLAQAKLTWTASAAARRREPAVLQHSALKHGAPSSENLRAFQHFVVAYDSRLRNPRWVLERISRERSGGDAQRRVCPPFPELQALCACAGVSQGRVKQEECGVR